MYITKQALPFAEVSQMKGVKLPKGDIVILDLEAIDIIQPLLAIQCSTCKAEFKELRDLEKHVKSAHKLAFWFAETLHLHLTHYTVTSVYHIARFSYQNKYCTRKTSCKRT